MSGAEHLPGPIAILIAVGLLGGSALTLAGAIGFTRLKTFYQRVHAPTLGSSMGMVLILASSILYFSVKRGAFVFHEALIAVFLSLTMPISLMLVVRAALARDRHEGVVSVPPVGDSPTSSQGS
jgi:multicomponent K+:H+ antiporter subunit G